jgi:UDP-N-acetylmuramate--alanine ligase
VTAVFQPHLYSRTARLAREFAAALHPAARVFVTDVYAAREEPLPDVSGQLITDALADHPRAHYVADWRELIPLLRVLPAEGVLVIMGAGDITGLGPALLADALGLAGADGERGP